MHEDNNQEQKVHTCTSFMKTKSLFPVPYMPHSQELIGLILQSPGPARCQHGAFMANEPGSKSSKVQV